MDNNNGKGALREERMELEADGAGKNPPEAEEVVEAAAAQILPVETTPAPQSPAPRDPIADLLNEARDEVAYGRSHFKSKDGKASRAKRFGLVDELTKAVDEVHGWVEIVPALVDTRGNMGLEQFEKSMKTFERAFGRLKVVLNDLAVRRCEPTIHSIEGGIAIVENPKWRGPKVSLENARRVLKDLKRAFETGRASPRVNERGESAAWTLWRSLDGLCHTCGSKSRKDLCNPCREAIEADRRREQQEQADADSDLLARLRQQLKKS